MDDMSKVAFVTGSRADYGIMRRYLRFMKEDQDIELLILVTGALLDPLYGHQVELIYRDGFKIVAEINLRLDASSNAAILQTMAEALEKFGIYFEKNRFDLLIILGDRYEMMAVATAAAVQKIPILHIHGGESTYGNYDEFIRHSITKMSLYHFTATEIYRNRVIQMGEAPENVFNLGALGAENCMLIEERNVSQNIKNLVKKNYFVILFHPETLTNVDTFTQIKELIAAIECFRKYQFIFIGANADTHSDIIRDTIFEYVHSHENAIYYENLHTDAYHFLLKNSICLIGNSSSGIIEAPSLGIATINIGDRQKGRVKGDSVIDVTCKAEEIKSAMKYVIETLDAVVPVNPYYQTNAARKYYEITKTLLERISCGESDNPKFFYDK